MVVVIDVPIDPASVRVKLERLEDVYKRQQAARAAGMDAVDVRLL